MKQITMALAAACWACTAALAQAPAAPESQAALTKGEIKAQQQFKMLDFNGDGKLSRKEVAIIPKLAAAFDETDTNKDGYVTYEEVRAYAVKYRADRGLDKKSDAAPTSTPATTESATQSEAASAESESK